MRLETIRHTREKYGQAQRTKQRVKLGFCEQLSLEAEICIFYASWMDSDCAGDTFAVGLILKVCLERV